MCTKLSRVDTPSLLHVMSMANAIWGVSERNQPFSWNKQLPCLTYPGRQQSNHCKILFHGARPRFLDSPGPKLVPQEVKLTSKALAFSGSSERRTSRRRRGVSMSTNTETSPRSASSCFSSASVSSGSSLKNSCLLVVWLWGGGLDSGEPGPGSWHYLLPGRSRHSAQTHRTNFFFFFFFLTSSRWFPPLHEHVCRDSSTHLDHIWM